MHTSNVKWDQVREEKNINLGFTAKWIMNHDSNDARILKQSRDYLPSSTNQNIRSSRFATNIRLHSVATDPYSSEFNFSVSFRFLLIVYVIFGVEMLPIFSDLL